MEHFADNVRRLLGLHAVTSKELAAATEIDPATISQWLSGRRRPSFRTALAVAAFFGVSADRLATAPFADLLVHDLADTGRFIAVEVKLGRSVARTDNG